MAEEIDTDCIKKVTDDKCRHAIKISNGNFFWNNANDEKQEISKEHDDKKKQHIPETLENITTGFELKSVAEIDKQPLLNGFQQENQIENLATNNPILKNINLEIKKGAFIAILGEYLSFILTSFY